MRILIVEDEAIVAMALQLELRRNGHECILAATAEEAIENAGSSNPDIVLMDINLAGRGDGIDAAREITESYRVPICFVSGYDSNDIDPDGLGFTPLGYLNKPVRYEDIRDILETVGA
jgi:DNA-binding response OmpR family regulator